MRLGKIIVDIDGLDLSKNDIDLLQHPFVGGVILFARNFLSVDQIIHLIESIKQIRSPSLIIYVDQEGGRVQRFKEEMTVLPAISMLGKKYKNDGEDSLILSKELGWLIGYELRCIGIDVNTAPVLDINYNRSNVMQGRCFSEDPKDTSLLSEAFIIGTKESGISSICKHYPGHGYAKTDSHIELPQDNRGLKTIFNDDLMPYKKAIKLGIEGIMTSHVLYKNIDQYPPTLSSKWLQILKNDLRYKGLIFSDDLSMNALKDFGDIEDNVLKSLKVGCDCIFICNNRKKVEHILDNLVLDMSDDISNKLINLSRNRIKDNFKINKRRLSVINNLKKIADKKQIEIKL